MQFVNAPLFGTIFDEESDERGNGDLTGEELIRWWTDSINPLTLDAAGDLDTSGVVADDWVGVEADCSCRSSFFTEPSQ